MNRADVFSDRFTTSHPIFYVVNDKAGGSFFKAHEQSFNFSVWFVGDVKKYSSSLWLVLIYNQPYWATFGSQGFDVIDFPLGDIGTHE
jgi:hypothetical protein